MKQIVHSCANDAVVAVRAGENNRNACNKHHRRYLGEIDRYLDLKAFARVGCGYTAILVAGDRVGTDQIPAFFDILDELYCRVSGSGISIALVCTMLMQKLLNAFEIALFARDILTGIAEPPLRTRPSNASPFPEDRLLAAQCKSSR